MLLHKRHFSFVFFPPLPLSRSAMSVYSGSESGVRVLIEQHIMSTYTNEPAQAGTGITNEYMESQRLDERDNSNGWPKKKDKHLPLSVSQTPLCASVLSKRYLL